MTSAESGFLLIDKGEGPTSHDIIDRIRKITGIRKVGHTGTLDPMATGLLVVGVGRYTRLLRFFAPLSKTYRAQAILGQTTTTLDAEGEKLSEVDLSHLSQNEVADKLSDFVGEITQIPPMVSAVKVAGKRLHQLAREGKEVERNPRKVTIFSLELDDFVPATHPKLSLTVEGSAGTYIRTLVDDLGQAVGGTGGHIISLRRMAIGHLRVDEAVTTTQLAAEDWTQFLFPSTQALSHLTCRQVTAEQSRLVSSGRPLPLSSIELSTTEPGGVTADQPILLTDHAHNVAAVYRVKEEMAVAQVVLT